MQITIIQVGKTSKKYFIEAEKEYLKRLQPYAELNVITVKEAQHGSNPTPSEIEQIKQKEAQNIIAKIGSKSTGRTSKSPSGPTPGNSFIITLDEHGTQLTSPKFAELIQQKRDQSANIVVIIGGAFGLHSSILNKSHLMLSFSKFTFTHQMIRPLLLEQLYRAFTIISGKKYHY